MTFTFALVHMSVCPYYQNGIGGHLTVNRTKENNRVHSVTMESIEQKKIAKEMAPYSIWLHFRLSVHPKYFNFVTKVEKLGHPCPMDIF